MKLIDKIKKLIVKDEPLEKEIPYTGGNLYSSKVNINQREHSLKNWLNIESQNIHNTLQRLSNNSLITYNFWYLMNFQADYFINNVYWKTKDSLLYQLVNIVFRTHFLYGNVGVLHKEGKFIPLVLSKIESNEFNEITYCEGYIAYDMLNNQISSVQDVKNLKLYKINDMENFTFLRMNSFGVNGMVKWRAFILQQETLLKRIYNASIVMNKKLIFNCNDENAAIREIQALYNDHSSIIVNKDLINPINNIVNTDTTIDNQTQEMFDYYSNFIQTYYHLLGRRINSDSKRERNVAGEVETTQHSLALLEREDYNLKYYFLMELKEKYGANLEVEEWKENIDDIEKKEQTGQYAFNGDTKQES